MTPTAVINRDWNKLKNNHGKRWALKYFEAADKLFNPNEVTIFKYQYSGLVTEEPEGLTFHAITDIGFKSGPRVVFSIKVENKG